MSVECGKKFMAKADEVKKGAGIYCSRACMYKQQGKDRKGSGTPWFKGGSIHTQGYKVISLEDGSRFLEHRYVMEQHLGRKLARNEEVHHKDGNKLNNGITNLQLMTKSEHTKLHYRLVKTTGSWTGEPGHEHNLPPSKKSTVRYKTIYVNGKEVKEHIYLIEQKLGRNLLPNEIVHHKDEDKTNNDLANLEVMTRSEHTKHHNQRNRDNGWFLGRPTK